MDISYTQVLLNHFDVTTVRPEQSEEGNTVTTAEYLIST